MPTRSPTGREVKTLLTSDAFPSQTGELGELLGDLGAADALGSHDQQRVVAGHRAEDGRQRRAIQGRADDVRRPWRGAEYDQVGGVGDLDHPVAEDAAEVVFGRTLLLRELGDGVDRLASPG